jgi:hypothetical protein
VLFLVLCSGDHKDLAAYSNSTIKQHCLATASYWLLQAFATLKLSPISMNPKGSSSESLKLSP